MIVVVDTNVAVVAESLAKHADQACIDACTDRLLAIMRSGVLVLDEGDVIVVEYARKLGHAGQPGIGRAFVKWAWDSRFDAAKCLQVAVTERSGHDWRRFQEFPDQANLSTFHKKDQKFVAVAIASNINPPILNAVDSDWWDHRIALAEAGIIVEFLCPQHAP